MVCVSSLAGSDRQLGLSLVPETHRRGACGCDVTSATTAAHRSEIVSGIGRRPVSALCTHASERPSAEAACAWVMPKRLRHSRRSDWVIGRLPGK